jgi:Flp pilus assembly protein TadG
MSQSPPAGRFHRQCTIRQRGVMAVEFAIVSILFFLLLFSIIEGGRAIWIYNTMAHAASEGARHAIVRGGLSTAPATAPVIESYVLGTVGGLSGLTVTTTWADSTKMPGTTVTVTASYPFTPILPVPIGNLTLSKSSTMAIRN